MKFRETEIREDDYIFENDRIKISRMNTLHLKKNIIIDKRNLQIPKGMKIGELYKFSRIPDQIKSRNLQDFEDSFYIKIFNISRIIEILSIICTSNRSFKIHENIFNRRNSIRIEFLFPKILQNRISQDFQDFVKIRNPA